jgi:hypothetical protein
MRQEVKLEEMTGHQLEIINIFKGWKEQGIIKHVRLVHERENLLSAEDVMELLEDETLIEGMQGRGPEVNEYYCEIHFAGYEGGEPTSWAQPDTMSIEDTLDKCLEVALLKSLTSVAVTRKHVQKS